MQRQPAVAGQFYPDDPQQLQSELEHLIVTTSEKKHVRGIVAPHAGYVYSGGVAGQIYGMIEIPPSVLILGPNHHGSGEAAALYPSGDWLTPLGPVSINNRLNDLIRQHSPLVKNDTIAHRFEHSLEVQLPFLATLRPDVTISALCLGIGDYPVLRGIGEGIAAAIRAYGDDVLIVASSDMSHFETDETARKKDALALERVLAFDPEGLLGVCRSERITMCGVVPTVLMMLISAELGAKKAELVAYATSGDVCGDRRRVVGYAAVTVS